MQRAAAALAAVLSAAAAVKLDTRHRATQIIRRTLLALPLASCTVKADAMSTLPHCVLVAGPLGRSSYKCVRLPDANARYKELPLVRSAAQWHDVLAAVGLATQTAVKTNVMAPAHVDDVICDVGFVPTFVAEADRHAALAANRDNVVNRVKAAERLKLAGRFVLVLAMSFYFLYLVLRCYFSWEGPILSRRDSFFSRKPLLGLCLAAAFLENQQFLRFCETLWNVIFYFID